MEQYDLVIFGTGSGNSIITPALDDWRVAVVEEGAFGGTCLNRGCIPTKILVHTADTAYHVTHAARFGIDAHVDAVHWPAIRDRVFGRIDPIAEGGERYRTFDCPNVTVHKGHGTFVAPRTIEVRAADGSTTSIQGEQVVVATGARPMIPDLPGIHDVPFHTSDDIMRIAAVPEHLIVLGGGFIACELAHVFGALGARVTIVQRGMHLLKHEDHDVSAAITTDFVQRFDLRTGVHVARIARAGDGVAVHLADGTVVEGSHLLVATGRIPNSDLIDAAAGGLALHPDGRVVVDAQQRTGVPGVWALGDISSPYMLKHVANHEARVVAHNVVAAKAGDAALRSTDHTFVPHAVFTNPQIAAVGLTEMEARSQGIDVMIATQRYGDIAFGWALEDTTSFCKLIADRATRRLVGAHIIGPAASSLIQQLVQGMRFGQTIDQLAHDQYYIHPALGELVENALLQFPAA
jgi:mycothione reductase